MYTPIGIRLLMVWMTIGLNAVSGEIIYKERGQILELQPNTSLMSQPFKRILWRFGDDKLADYDTDFDQNVDVYGTFKTRTNLDVKTGFLKITGLKDTDSGLYKVEFNTGLEWSYRVAVINQVPKPVIKVNPSCDQKLQSCSLTCEASNITNAEPVTFMWKVGSGPWQLSDKTLTINETDNIKFTCKIQNPVSEKESEPIDNPLVPPIPYGLILGILIGCVVALGLASQFVPVLKKKRDAMFKSCKRKENGADRTGGPASKTVHGSTQKESSNDEPLIHDTNQMRSAV